MRSIDNIYSICNAQVEQKRDLKKSRMNHKVGEELGVVIQKAKRDWIIRSSQPWECQRNNL